MLQGLPDEVLEHILRFAPQAAGPVRLVTRMAWTSGMVQRASVTRFCERFNGRNRRRRQVCVRRDCIEPSVDTIVWFAPRSVCSWSPYCRNHVPEGLLDTASIYTVGEGRFELWW